MRTCGVVEAGDSLMRRNSVAMVWLFGLIATIAVYEIGPDRFVANFIYGLEHFGDTLDILAGQLIYGAFDLMRALALGLFGVFVVLCAIASRRGIRSIRTLVVVGVLFFALIGAFGVDDGFSLSRHWLGAFLLAGAGAAVMTRRLSRPGAMATPGAGWMAR